jgi:hypothetical protein
MFAFIFYLINKQTIKKYIMLTLITVSSLMVGSKTLYFFLLASLIYYVFVVLKQRFRINKPYLFTVIFGVLLALVFFTVKFILPLNQSLYILYQDEGFITLFFSLRDKLALDAIDIVHNRFVLINYLFGGMAFVPKTTEIAILDLLLTFGVVGASIFLYFLRLNFPKWNKLNLKFLLTIILISVMLRGNFFYFPSVIYLSLAIFAMILTKSNNNNIILTENETNFL